MEAGVLVLVLLPGVTPVEKKNTKLTSNTDGHKLPLTYLSLLGGTRTGFLCVLTWHRLLVMILEPAEEPVNCGKNLASVSETFRRDGDKLNPERQGYDTRPLHNNDLFFNRRCSSDGES